MRFRRTPEEQDLYETFRAAQDALDAHGEAHGRIEEGTPEYEEYLDLNAEVAAAERAMVNAGMPWNLRGMA